MKIAWMPCLAVYTGKVAERKKNFLFFKEQKNKVNIVKVKNAKKVYARIFLFILKSFSSFFCSTKKGKQQQEAKVKKADKKWICSNFFNGISVRQNTKESEREKYEIGIRHS